MNPIKYTLLALIALGMTFLSQLSAQELGSKERPLRVMLVPADGGTEDGTLADFKPMFNSLSKTTGLHFDMKVGQSYAAVITAMVNQQADIAWFGAVSYLEAKKRGGAELLSLSVKKGESVYYSGIFVPRNSGINSLADLKGKDVAFGDPHSTSSFVYPMAMIIKSGIDPIRDLKSIRLTGSHTNSLNALSEGHVDAACASFTLFEKAVKNGAIDATKFKPLVKSDPIPNPPMALNPKLSPIMKAKLRVAIHEVHQAPGIEPGMIRGYGGKKVDRYNADVRESVIETAGSTIALVSEELRVQILAKASER
jgi:phosphonate transport system substrate-binding protein